MSLSAAVKQELVRTAHRALMDRAAAGTIDTANPLEQLSELDAAWQDPEASWALASTLLRVSERCQAELNGSDRDRSHTNLVYSVTLAIYDQTRVRRLTNSQEHRPRSAA
jgi:hypothetical protein